ncbi:MAG: hypothetical protein QM714_08820 [Nocardioides sp.]|uniref:hypothetical protein n=1 Tax=Nocardioides sp. TaxID=35761 RepID=UPI0039E2E0DC
MGEEDWGALGLPYGVLDREANPPMWRLAYGAHMVEFPFAEDDREDTPYTDVLSMTATKNAGIFELQHTGQAAEVWMLTTTGE